jgi:urease accessory protein
VLLVIVEQIVTHITDIPEELLQKHHVERVYLESSDLVKRIQRVVTDAGREIGIRLTEPKDLVAGDVLYMDDHHIILVDVVPDDLLVIRPMNFQQMGEVAHRIGNRHLPAQFEGNTMLVQYDYLIEELLQESGIPYSREHKKVKQAFRHIGHIHG